MLAEAGSGVHILMTRFISLLCAQPVNTFIITARECTRALAEQRLVSAPGVRSRLAGLGDTLGVELRIAALSLLAWWAALTVRWTAPPRPKQARRRVAAGAHGPDLGPAPA